MSGCERRMEFIQRWRLKEVSEVVAEWRAKRGIDYIGRRDFFTPSYSNTRSKHANQ